MMGGGELSASEIVQKTMGSSLFMYYQYGDKFGHAPVDIDDMVDGICYIELKNFFERRAIEKQRAEAKANGR